MLISLNSGWPSPHPHGITQPTAHRALRAHCWCVHFKEVFHYTLSLYKFPFSAYFLETFYNTLDPHYFLIFSHFCATVQLTRHSRFYLDFGQLLGWISTSKAATRRYLPPSPRQTSTTGRKAALDANTAASFSFKLSK